MKKVTVFIDDEYADVITITSIGQTSGIEINLTVAAYAVKDGMIIKIPDEKGGETND